jgi:TRAP-type uncharacterized transport system substrate-binding protein
MNIKFALAALVGVMMATVASAQEASLKIGTGPEAFVYSKMFADYQDFVKKRNDNTCANVAVPQSKEVQTSGGMDNINNILANLVDGGIAQDDVVQLLGTTNPKIAALKSLATLHTNHLHIVALVKDFAYKTEVTRPAKFYEKGETITDTVESKKSIRTLMDLKGLPVAAVGSGYVTAYNTDDRAAMGMIVNEYKSITEAMADLKAGKVAAIMAMGGMPLPWITEGAEDKKDPSKSFGKLTASEFVLVSAPMKDEGFVKKLGSPYFASQLVYPNLNAQGTWAISVKNQLFVRDYKSASKQQALATLRGCFEKWVPEMREALGTHPSWQDVDDVNGNTALNWARYDAKRK